MQGDGGSLGLRLVAECVYKDRFRHSIDATVHRVVAPGVTLRVVPIERQSLLRHGIDDGRALPTSTPRHGLRLETATTVAPSHFTHLRPILIDAYGCDAVAGGHYGRLGAVGTDYYDVPAVGAVEQGDFDFEAFLFSQVFKPSPHGADTCLALERGVLDHLAQAVVGVDVDEAFGVFFCEALLSYRSGNIGRHQYQTLVAAVHTESARAEERTVSERLEQTFGRGVPLILDVKLAIGDEYAYGAFAGSESLIDVERLPGAHVFVLGDAVHELTRRADSVHVHLSGIPVSQVAEAE